MAQKAFTLSQHPDFDWSDVEPLQQYEGKFPILDIKYSMKYEKLMDIFRRIVHNNEISERVYYLTGEVVSAMCGSYTAWVIRKNCLEKLGLSYEKELEFTTELFHHGNEKNYQIWEHRRFLITKINKPDGEIEFLENLLAKDNKNIHAWGFRKWLVDKFNLFEQERANLQKFFDEDIRNNSAWNFRYFLYKDQINNQTLHDELKYIFTSIKEVYDNEAVWNYLNGWFYTYNFECFGQKSDFSPAHLKKFHYKDYPELEIFVREVVKDDPQCRFAWATLLNILIWKQTKEALTECIEIIENLSTVLDKIRFNYWEFYQTNLKKDFQAILA